jgi:hypothetical protein
MMDARDRERFLDGLRMEHATEDKGVETSEARMTDTPAPPDLQDT